MASKTDKAAPAPRKQESPYNRAFALDLAAKNPLPGDTSSGKETIIRAEAYLRFLNKR